jgi:hypothetical protein
MPDSVPLKVQERVALVLAKRNTPFDCILAEQGFWLIQQGTNQLDARVTRRRISPLHPGKPLAAAASEQSHKEQFQSVIRVMRQGDQGDAPPPRNARQEIVSQFSSGHLQGDSLSSGHIAHRRPRDDYR